MHLGIAGGERPQGLADLQESIAEILPAMTRDQHERPRGPSETQYRRQFPHDAVASRGLRIDTGEHPEQGVDDRVTGHDDTLGRYPLGQ